jgi:hypothetical protein
VASQFLYLLDPPESFTRDCEKGAFGQSDVKVSEIVAEAEDRLIVLERGSETTKIYRAQLEHPVAAEHLDVDTRPTLEELSGRGDELPALGKTLLISTDEHPEVAADLEGMVILSPTSCCWSATTTSEWRARRRASGTSGSKHRCSSMAEARIGTAGWSIALAHADAFPAEGAGLERYAARFDCSEINSTFHRPHRASTYERWAASVPEGFRFSAKLPKTITHERRLVDAEPLLAAFLAEVQPLADSSPCCWCSFRQAWPSIGALPSVSCWHLPGLPSFGSCANRAIPAGSTPKPRLCWWSGRSPGWRPIRPRFRQRRFPAAGAASATFGCMGRRCRTGRATRPKRCRPMPT